MFIYLAIIGLAALTFYYYTYLRDVVPLSSGYPYAIALTLFGVILYMIIDDVFYPKINTQELLRQNPIAYAIYLLGCAIIIGLILSTA